MVSIVQDPAKILMVLQRARFSTACRICTTMINEGDLITPFDEDYYHASGKFDAVHPDCRYGFVVERVGVPFLRRRALIQSLKENVEALSVMRQVMPSRLARIIEDATTLLATTR